MNATYLSVKFKLNLLHVKSTSGKSSKFDVSSIDFTSTGIAAGLSLKKLVENY